jgi:hypothetical protein
LPFIVLYKVIALEQSGLPLDYFTLLNSFRRSLLNGFRRMIKRTYHILWVKEGIW